MRRGANEADALVTINAAATAIASVEGHGARASVQKRMWGCCFSISWCFGSNKNRRIGPAVVIPDITVTEPDTSAVGHSSQSPSIVLPFPAHPSSPASFLPSGSPSAVQSPTGTSISANMYSPGGPSSIFTIGPYAHETRLVSPPVFSTFTTEPSTAPYTPPPESVHMTTPSSPEVPFARLLEPTLPNVEGDQRYNEFHSYHLQPGSPVSHLISPSSGISGSGTSSPFPDLEFHLMHPSFPEFRIGNQQHQKKRTVTLGSSKEFNFDNVDGTTPHEPSIGPSDWWANEKVVTEEGSPCKNWAFFRVAVIQTGVS